ncbi:MAG: inositol monophosphatase [Candidatus Taylorbacteria bacterium]|nr:inositol monophosphatase [Candidatus Taylorbacteria bacterium]
MNTREQKAIITAAHAGGEVLLKYFGSVLSVEQKSIASDVRTQADVGSEKVILRHLEKAFPTYNILSEECGLIDKKSDYTFYIDPLDGTNNFVLGIPNFSVSIALCQGKNVVAGVIHLPLTGQTYSAVKGKGSLCNGKKIEPSVETNLLRSTVAFMCGYHYSRSKIADTLGKLSGKMKRILTNWSVASDMCLLASGKIETVVARDGMQPYDFLAGKLIAKEAGCVLTDGDGKTESDDFKDAFMASGNKVIHKKMLSLAGLE